MAYTGRRRIGSSAQSSALLLLLGVAGFYVAFLALPLASMFVRSFMKGDGSLGELTLDNYKIILMDPYYLEILGRSLYLGMIVTLVCLPLGFTLAYVIARLAKGAVIRKAIYFIILAPLFTSSIVRAFGWIVLLGREGWVNKALMEIGLVAEPVSFLFNMTGIVIGLVHILTPFMVLPIASILHQTDVELEMAAADLGASPWRAFTTVTLPLSLPGILTGCLIVFSLTVSSYVVPAVLGGGRIKLFASLVYDAFMTRFDWSLGSALAIVLLASTQVIVLIVSRILRQRHHFVG